MMEKKSIGHPAAQSTRYPLILCRHDLLLHPDSSRVIIRPFIPLDTARIDRIIQRVLELDEAEVSARLGYLLEEFDARHFEIEEVLLRHYDKVRGYVSAGLPLTRERQLLIGAMFSGEYALESAALFNPSIVPHPDQNGVPPGSLRFIMSLRATGEGHISSIEFRTGVISDSGCLTIDPVSRFVCAPEILPNPRYRKRLFVNKLREMSEQASFCAAVMDPLKDSFTLSELEESIARAHDEVESVTTGFSRTLERIRWLAQSNYELSFPTKLALSERILFPVSANESNGIEDARFVRFTDDDGSVTYYATYTAYNGHAILPQLIETRDFANFNILTLNGSAVHNKGMALFPRRVGGHYLMLSRQDDESLYLMRSDDPHHWDYPVPLMQPRECWESVKIGNCGSPVETDAGWLVIIHGVGPMRKYCIGAALLDLEDPARVIGRLDEPLIVPEGNEREGYVPNVVYSCGYLVHERRLILPYAMSDRATAMASLSLELLLKRLQEA
jgi:predicted GH43/DUF377 family glycosyl hydrolase